MKSTKLLPTVTAVSLTIFIPLVAANAQKTDANQSATRQTAGIVDRTSIDKDKDAANEIQELREQVQQLRAIVEQQQQSLTRLEQRLDDRARPNAANAEQTAANLAPNPGDDKATEAKPASTQPDKGQKTAPLLAGWNGEHAFLRSADGRFETNITGYAQLDFRGYQRGNHPPNTFVIRRARLALEGRLMHDFEFRIQGDFADTTSTLLRDFYVRYHHVDSIQATFGQFRLPYSPRRDTSRRRAGLCRAFARQRPRTQSPTRPANLRLAAQGSLRIPSWCIQRQRPAGEQYRGHAGHGSAFAIHTVETFRQLLDEGIHFRRSLFDGPQSD